MQTGWWSDRVADISTGWHCVSLIPGLFADWLTTLSGLCLHDWHNGWLFVCLANWLLTRLLSKCLTAPMTGWFNRCLPCRRTDWVSGRNPPSYISYNRAENSIFVERLLDDEAPIFHTKVTIRVSEVGWLATQDVPGVLKQKAPQLLPWSAFPHGGPFR
jgi:hypothetical protein